MESTPATPDRRPALQLALATGAFAVCFAVFGSVAGMMPVLTERLHLTEPQVGVALAVPILLGSLGRIPAGMLADRIGGRRVFLAVMLASLVPAAVAPYVESYPSLLVCLFFLGIPLAVFSVGVAFVSGWYPPARQGMALGVYGAGVRSIIARNPLTGRSSSKTPARSPALPSRTCTGRSSI